MTRNRKLTYADIRQRRVSRARRIDYYRDVNRANVGFKTDDPRGLVAYVEHLAAFAGLSVVQADDAAEVAGLRTQLADAQDRVEFVEHEWEHDKDGRAEWFERAMTAEALARRLAGQVVTLEAKVDAIRALHWERAREIDGMCVVPGDCADCGQRYPCATVRAVLASSTPTENKETT